MGNIQKTAIKLLQYIFVVIIIFASDLNAQWKICNEKTIDLKISSIGINGNNFYIGTFGSGIYFSNDSANSFVTKNNGLNHFFISAFGFQDNIVFVGTEDGMYCSTDDGNNWVQKNDGIKGTNYSVASIVFKDNQVFVGMYGGGIYLSTDLGHSWIQRSSGLAHMGVTSLLIKDNELFAGMWGGYGVQFSLDNGDNWEQKNNGLQTNYIRVLTANNFLFCGTGDKGIYFSSDNGHSWIESNEGITNKNIYCFVVHNNIIFAGSYGGGVFCSFNNGLSWQPVIEGLNNLNITSLAIKDSVIFAGTLAGVYYAKIGDLLNTIGVEYENLINFLSVSPNPATETTNITFELESDSHVSMSVSDILGNEVAELLINEYYSSGKHSVQFNTGNLSAGIYFCTMKAGSRIETRKIVVLE